MKWFKEGLSPYQTALAMIGAKGGQQVLVIGTGCGPIAAEVALVTGLNGRVLVIDRDRSAQAAVEAAAAKAGALIEFAQAPSSMLPVDPGAFDIAVLHTHLAALPPSEAHLVLAEARRVLRPGGRLIVMERTARPGLFGAIQIGRGGHREPPADPKVIIDLLKAGQFLSVRLLADAEGTAYVEGRRGSGGETLTE